MDKKTAPGQTTKTKRKKTANSPDFTSFDPTANLKSPQEILELGQIIVQQLKLQERGEVLTRWIAHHLAELIAEAAQAVGPAKVEAEKRAVDLILKLWLHRRALPEPVDPLGSLRPAIAVLERLMPDQNPWHFHRKPGDSLETILQDIFQNMARVTLAGIELTQRTQVRPIAKAEENMLETEEVRLLAMLERWKPCIATQPNQEIIYQRLISGEETAAAPDDNALVGNAKDRAQIIDQLEQMQARLEILLTRFKGFKIAKITTTDSSD